MTEAIIIAIIGFLGAVVGSGLGIIASAKLTNYRLEQLEIRVKEHNNFGIRVQKLEDDIKYLKDEVKELK